MKELKRNSHLLHVLKSADKKLRKGIIENSNKDLIRALTEIIHNLLNGNIKISGKQKQRLCKYKSGLERLEKDCVKRRKIYINKARKKLVQVGGALPFIIPLILPLIAKAALAGAVSAGTGYATKKIIEKASG